MSSDQTNQDLRKKIEATLVSFLAAYEDGKAQNNPSLINRDVTPDCLRHLLPTSLCKSLGLPPDFAMNNEIYEQNYANDLKLGGVHDTVNTNLVIDVDASKAALTTKSDLTFNEGDLLVLEFAWFFDLNEDGSKIKRVVEFADPDAVKAMEARGRQAALETSDKGS
ncbi:hypothetical protein FSARC_9336 [Fusarium sarcochroum]|uniref:Uncharacterized protein n=1 Tax=Fusarium sarcochroum TaxID=1208366 RepID=A0A8H4TR88_9HYPO|nr:hypothetical protein FSARC_9336 [Fusarium sarcochroum]